MYLVSILFMWTVYVHVVYYAFYQSISLLSSDTLTPSLFSHLHNAAHPRGQTSSSPRQTSSRSPPAPLLPLPPLPYPPPRPYGHGVSPNLPLNLPFTQPLILHKNPALTLPLSRRRQARPTRLSRCRRHCHLITWLVNT